MVEDKYRIPLSQIGNSKNPRLVILLANPAGDTEKENNLPEDKMGNLYSCRNMKFNIFRKYCSWWDEILKIINDYDIKDNEICSLDYYQYHTKSSKFIPNKKYWTQEALDSLEINKKLLKGFMEKQIPIFGYYWGDWLKENKKLEKYKFFYKSKNAWRATKKKELRVFLETFFK